jgi:hypothetical protein
MSQQIEGHALHVAAGVVSSMCAECSSVLRAPSRFSASELKRAGVTLIDPDRVLLQCDACASQWSPNLLSGGRLPRGYWKCSRGCNADL